MRFRALTNLPGTRGLWPQGSVPPELGPIVITQSDGATFTVRDWADANEKLGRSWADSLFPPERERP